jgi:hypothetical protein
MESSPSLEGASRSCIQGYSSILRNPKASYHDKQEVASGKYNEAFKSNPLPHFPFAEEQF